MNGASTGQDLMYRAIGRTRAGDPIDLEVEDRIGKPGVAGSAFTYLRYNADLSARALANAGITDPAKQPSYANLPPAARCPSSRSWGGGSARRAAWSGSSTVSS